MVGVDGRKERKTVTVLFADLVGFTSRAEALDPEDVEAILEPYHARLRAELERFAGTVEKFIGDAVVALFGAPVAHEDDPERAVRASLAIRDWARREGVEVRVAVNTGEALVRVDAHPETGEGMAAGDVVNTAARLQAAAPVGGVLVGEGTYRATRQVIDYRRAEPVVAKGKAEPVAVWEAIAAREPLGLDVSRSHATPLVSRKQELDALKSALARACKGRSELFTLMGVPGIGKSRLVHELAHSAEGEGVTWRRGRSLPYGAGVSFWALTEMVKRQAAILETDPPEVAGQKLGQAISALISDERDLVWVERHLQPLVGLGGGAPAGGDRRAESFAAWRRFLAAVAAEKPLALVFEDLHWGDDDLLDFVESLPEWLGDAPLFILCTARPELLERRLAWAGGKAASTTLSVAPLNDTDTATLIGKLIERAVVPEETRALLLDRAGGNPLYAEQYVRMLVERGDAEGVPESVQGIIAARLDALSTDDKQLLQSGAVIGQVFWPGAVAAITGGDRWTVVERLHGLERKELVRHTAESPVADETAYAFAHMLVRDVAYGQIPRGQRAEKHRLAAQWIESLGRPEDHAEMLAHHYARALEYARAAGQSTDELVVRARVALRDAGDRSFALNAYAAAARSYAAARELWPEGDVERARLAFFQGRARFFAEEAGAEELSEASELLEAAGDMEAAADAELLISDLSHRHADADASTAHLARARSLVEDLGASAAKARVDAMTARRLMLAGDLEVAINFGREALRLAEELGLDELRANALNTIGNARVWGGDPAGAEEMERSAALSAEIASGSELVRAKGNLMAWTIARGDIRMGTELARELLEIAERFGQAPALRWFHVARLTPPYWRGDWDQAIRVADEFIAEVEAGAPHYNAMQFYAYRGQIRLARDDVAVALEDAGKAVAVARLVTDTQQLPRALGLSAFAFAEAGALDRAAPLVEEAMAMLAAGVELLMAVAGLPALAEAARILGRSADLKAALGDRFGWSLWADAARAIAMGDLVHAAEICHEIETKPDEALIRLRAAEAMAAEGHREEAKEQLSRALAFYRAVGATRYIRKAETLLAAKPARPKG